tara:strand:- start:26 stop:415 length:390 start_codon:yes stop_codon:yes gene_type:complete
MANGTIAFDTLTTSDSVKSGTEKSIDTSYLFNGIAKAFVNGGADASLNNSFNISTNTDNGTGDYSYGFTNVFTTEVDLHCAIAAICIGGDRFARIQGSNSTTSAVNLHTVATTTNTNSIHALQLTGDLA